MAKKKKKDKKIKASKKKIGEEKKTKKPTEKELFERQIEELRRLLESANLDLERSQARLEAARESLHSEEDAASACVEHLKRAIQSESDSRLEQQERLLAERDLKALLERRALGKFAVSEQNEGVAKSLFLQQKTELEGKLSLLEELRLVRNSQLSHLERLEESLQEKTASLRERTRREDADRARQLLEDRETFLRMCRDAGSERREAFRLQIRVHAENQLRENVRLRRICERNTERLLEEQERSRSLRREQKSLELEKETLLLAERDVRRRKACLKRRRRDLLEASPDLRRRLQADKGMLQMIGHQADEGMSGIVEQEADPTYAEDGAKINDILWADKEVSQKAEQVEEELTPNEGGAEINRVSNESRVSSDADGRMSKQRPSSGSFDDDAIGSRGAAIRRRIESIRENEIQHCLLEDRHREMSAILRDQMEYRASLEDEVGQNVDRNGERMSAVLRAGRVLQARCGKLEREGMDFDLLHQIRMILDG